MGTEGGSQGCCLFQVWDCEQGPCCPWAKCVWVACSLHCRTALVGLEGTCTQLLLRGDGDLCCGTHKPGELYYTGIKLAKGVFVLKVCVWGGGDRVGKELAVMGRKGGCPDLSL